MLKLSDIHKYTTEEIENTTLHSQHYKCRNGDWFPYDKQDLKKVVDPYNPDTFIPLLKEMDYPFIKSRWELYLKCNKSNLESVFGRYIAYCNLYSIRPYGFEWSNFLNTKNFNLRP